MGLEIAIIVSDIPHQGSFEHFAYKLGLFVEKKDEEVRFDEAAFHWKNGFVDVLFGTKGTLVCVPFGDYNVAAASQASQVALLSISEENLAINLECAENGNMKRIYTQRNGAICRNVKHPLTWEDKTMSYGDLLSKCIKEFTGKDLWEYKNATAIRYRIIR